ncbi:MAG: alpha/beta fold hydrolase [Fimbriimonas sp.]|nr:alpha/beta fold hydrolase [Fimbriimonas sp.]
MAKSHLLPLPALLIAAATCFAAQASQSADGAWEGVWKKQGDSLAVRVEMHVQNGSWSGSFASQDMGVLDIPFQHIVVNEPQVSFDAVGDFTTTHFKGKLSGDHLYGALEESLNRPSASDVPVKGTFELHRSKSIARPYDIQPIKFKNGDVQLAGDLLVPKEGKNHPGVILVAGSMAQTRGAMMFVADSLARAGVVSLVYDKRGTGESTGDWHDASNEDLGADISAGVDLLATVPSVDPKRVGVYGHSQGGMIAPFVAVVNPRVKFLISAGGYGGPQFEQDLARVNRLLSQTGFSKADQKLAMDIYGQFIQTAKTGNILVRRAFLGSLKRYEGKEWLDWLGIPPENGFWWKLYPKTADFDPLKFWAKVAVPVLLLHGELDDTCPIHPGLDRTVQVLNETGHKDVTVKVLPSADHALRLVPKPGQVWSRLAPGFLGTLSAWILAR